MRTHHSPTPAFFASTDHTPYMHTAISRHLLPNNFTRQQRAKQHHNTNMTRQYAAVIGLTRPYRTYMGTHHHQHPLHRFEKRCRSWRCLPPSTGAPLILTRIRVMVSVLVSVLPEHPQCFSLRRDSDLDMHPRNEGRVTREASEMSRSAMGRPLTAQSVCA